MGGGEGSRKERRQQQRAAANTGAELYDDDGLPRKWQQSDLPDDDDGEAPAGKTKAEMRQHYKMLGNKKEKGKNQKGAPSHWGSPMDC